MTTEAIRKFFYVNGIMARVWIDYQNHTITVRVHPQDSPYTLEYLYNALPAGLRVHYKVLRWFDYWWLRNEKVVIT